MRRVSTSNVIAWPILVVVTAASYRFWLTHPILHELTLSQWRMAAILAAVVLGAVTALLRQPAYLVTSAVATGLLLGGVWAAFSAPHDVPTSFAAELVGHLRAFCREVVLLSVVSAASNFGCAYLFDKHRI